MGRGTKKNQTNIQPKKKGWVGSTHLPVHPDSPSGGGGPGNFEVSRPIGIEQEKTPGIPPVSHNFDSIALDVKNKPKQKSPPITKTLTATLKEKKADLYDVKINMEVLADAQISNSKILGKTNCMEIS